MVDRWAHARRTVEGGVLAIAIWCALHALHLLPAALSIVPGVFATAGAGMLVGLCGGARVATAVLAVITALAVIVMCSDLSDTVLSRWERRDPMPDGGVAAAVVLSAGLVPDTTISSEALDHLIAGVELVRAGRAPRLVTTTTIMRFPQGVLSSEADQARI